MEPKIPAKVTKGRMAGNKILVVNLFKTRLVFLIKGLKLFLVGSGIFFLGIFMDRIGLG